MFKTIIFALTLIHFVFIGSYANDVRGSAVAGPSPSASGSINSDDGNDVRGAARGGDTPTAAGSIQNGDDGPGPYYGRPRNPRRRNYLPYSSQDDDNSEPNNDQPRNHQRPSSSSNGNPFGGLGGFFGGGGGGLGGDYDAPTLNINPVNNAESKSTSNPYSRQYAGLN